MSVGPFVGHDEGTFAITTLKEQTRSWLEGDNVYRCLSDGQWFRCSEDGGVFAAWEMELLYDERNHWIGFS